jgi:hypothetical protein
LILIIDNLFAGGSGVEEGKRRHRLGVLVVVYCRDGGAAWMGQRYGEGRFGGCGIDLVMGKP